MILDIILSHCFARTQRKLLNQSYATSAEDVAVDEGSKGKDALAW